ncbi:ABC-F family ATP-binding cassette domain-containing protein [Holzapfeliella sp. He02]|uniref:ABC-F family ATP-binding cassette domain-containing protein n=1 Tax=Holzapfeliella saturejae TaxID=3082953 RepID=A0ABU8SEU1_9LACO
MAVLTINNLSHTFIDKEIYRDTNLQLNKEDHLGITGQNGVGKSTLIKILTGEMTPDEGNITWQKNLHIGYLDQYANLKPGQSVRQFLRTAFDWLYEQEQKMQGFYEQYATEMDDDYLEKAGKIQTLLEERGFYDIDTKIEVVASGLGIDAIGYDHDVSQLSGGQRSKLILAKLLLEHPDVLLLDEPTNYLDTNHIDWLSDFLNNFAGAFIVVSHDQDFLDKITNVIADIEFGKITKYTGSLEQAMKQKEANQITYMKAYENQQKHIEKTEAYIRKFKAGSRSKSAQSRQKQLNRLERMTPPKFNKQANLEFDYQPISARILVNANNLKIGYDGQALVEHPFNFSVANGEIVAIKGFNGIGKSTLLKTLLNIIPKIEGDIELAHNVKINYFEQTLKWANKKDTPLQILQAQYPDQEAKHLRQILARTGLTAQQVMSEVGTLSGGEQMKVKLASLMNQTSNLMFLDEPTNHLDAATKGALRRAIQDYEGGVIIVSHEADFFEGDWVDKVIDIEAMNK